MLEWGEGKKGGDRFTKDLFKAGSPLEPGVLEVVRDHGSCAMMGRVPVSALARTGRSFSCFRAILSFCWTAQTSHEFVILGYQAWECWDGRHASTPRPSSLRYF